MTYPLSQIVFAAIAGLVLVPILWGLFRLFTVEVEAESAVVLMRFGRVQKILREPGLYFWPEKASPWTGLKKISLKRDFRLYEEIHANDSRGTTMIIDLWIDFRVVDPQKALFHVEDWEGALRSLLTNAATSILGTFEFGHILCDRDKLMAALKANLQEESTRWGIEVDLVFVSKLSVLPEVARQLFDAVAARLEKAKADIEEAGKLEAALLDAETSAKVAALVTHAKGQYALGVSAAYSSFSANDELFQAYKQLHELSLVKPHRTVSFFGFSKDEVSAVEAGMMELPKLTGASAHDSGADELAPATF